MDEQEQVKIGMVWAATRAAAIIVLKELVYVQGGIGPWFDELQHRTITGIKNTPVSGIPMEQAIGTAVRVVEKIFDDVRDETTA
jgi:hypothetical protein